MGKKAGIVSIFVSKSDFLEKHFIFFWKSNPQEDLGLTSSSFRVIRVFQCLPSKILQSFFKTIWTEVIFYRDDSLVPEIQNLKSAPLKNPRRPKPHVTLTFAS